MGDDSDVAIEFERVEKIEKATEQLTMAKYSPSLPGSIVPCSLKNRMTATPTSAIPPVITMQINGVRKCCCATGSEIEYLRDWRYLFGNVGTYKE